MVFSQIVQNQDMNWKTIRLELGRTSEFPRGSPSRCYLLRLPLHPSGLIDGEALRASPGRATVSRFWPSQPDMFGHVLKGSKGWAFTYIPTRGDETTFWPEAHSIRVGEHITLLELDGQRLPFRVTSLSELN